MDFISRILYNAVCYPDHMAIVTESESMTYYCFFKRAFDYAKQLSSFFCNNKPIIILSQKTIVLYHLFFASLFSGAIYTPLNVNASESRNKPIIQSIDTNLLVIGDISWKMLKPYLPIIKHHHLLCTDKKIADKLKKSQLSAYFLGECKATDFVLNRNHFLYLFFTSGSTGLPKGVPIRYRHVNAYLEALQATFYFKKFAHYAQITDITFDLSIHEILTTFVNAGTLFVYPDHYPLGIGHFFEINRIHYGMLLPSFIPLIKKLFKYQHSIFNHTKRLFFCGEPFPINDAEALLQCAPHLKIVNLYGPTEATVACSYYEYNKHINDLAFMPIGIPLPGNEFILREQELCVGGEQVFEGYYEKSSIGSFYHTGDQVYFSKQHGYVFVGRLDDQWKFKGYRLEKNELEAVFRRVFNEEEIYITPLYGNNKLIDAFVVFTLNEINFNDNRDRINAFLPVDIFPVIHQQLKEIPRLVNQKVDYPKLKHLANHARRH